MKTAVLVPCFKRPEYTEKCIKALEEAQEYRDTTFFLVDDGSVDGTSQLLQSSTLRDKCITIRQEPIGLRNVILNFFDDVQSDQIKFDLISKVDNDTLVPKDWLNLIIDKFNTTDADILSPNVVPSNAAFNYGLDDKQGKGYRPAKTVGGIWTMRKKLIDGVQFEKVDSYGIKGAFSILKQIIIENSAKVGWLENVTYQDIGHWSGEHPEHIASQEHEEYSKVIGRPIAWSAK